MLKKLKEMMDRPMTWGGYLKLCAICLVISFVELYYMMVHVYGFYEGFGERFKKFQEKFGKKDF